jgi:hypothetical protein
MYFSWRYKIESESIGTSWKLKYGTYYITWSELAANFNKNKPK